MANEVERSARTLDFLDGPCRSGADGLGEMSFAQRQALLRLVAESITVKNSVDDV